ncbi:MAG: chitobiase/beta-hexosaminidase C-terminal domain-containing protein [Planctomycetes bacterium]|nr:chitobiase/beta-hexosaminidase C-terminal domain-containing protein [Planctomycetota bacterium]
MWSVYRPGNAAGVPAIMPYGGQFDGTVQVTLESSPRTPGCEIRYTLDGTEPTESSLLYTEPFTLGSTTTVRTRAFKDGMHASAIHRVTFVCTSEEGHIVSWLAVGHHGGQTVTTTVADNYVEPRIEGLRTLRIEFNKAVDPGTVTSAAIAVTGETSGDLSNHVNAVTTSAVNVVEVAFDPPLPDGEWVTVAVTSALHDTGGVPYEGDLDIRLGTLAGDVDGSGAVTAADMLTLRSKAGETLSGSTVRYDVDGSGEVSTGDMRAARGRLGGQLP